MKVLWITNMLLPEAKFLLDGESELKASGGWMVGAANGLLDNYDIVEVPGTVRGRKGACT